MPRINAGHSRSSHDVIVSLIGNDVAGWYRQFYPVFNRAGLIIDVEFYALRGETNAALRAAMDDDLWQFWRWRLLHNSNLDLLRGHSEFQAIVEQMEDRMAGEIESLEASAAGA